MSKKLQAIYAAQLADTTLQFTKHGILDKVTADKRAEQMKFGGIKAKQMGIQTKEEVFIILSDLFGCANWVLNEEQGTAKATGCMLCSMAKKMGAESPCRLYCLDPMEGMVKGIEKDAEFDVVSTLWDKNECLINIK